MGLGARALASLWEISGVLECMLFNFNNLYLEDIYSALTTSVKVARNGPFSSAGAAFFLSTTSRMYSIAPSTHARIVRTSQLLFVVTCTSLHFAPRSARRVSTS